MQPGLLIKLRPLGAWRFGPADGGHDRVDTLYRSDRLYSAITLAMQRLGLLDQWLDATVNARVPAVVFSSLFPFQGDTLYAIPPSTLWPPPALLLTTPSPVFLSKIRWKTARFVPLSVIDSLITGQPILADQWLPDPESGCLLRRDRPSASPFRVVVRSTAAVDRVTRKGDEVRSQACVEFEHSAGLWSVARFADAPQEKSWSEPLQAALRLLSDSGFGGGRGKGWGQTQAVEFQTGNWPAWLLPKLGRLRRNSSTAEGEASGGLYWLLSLYSPASDDKVDWSGGDYSLALRAGRVESHAGPQGALKKTVRMVTEGCVLAAGEEPVGKALDVAPDGFAHPVYRSGLALALRLPVVELRPQEQRAVEEPASEEAVIEELPPPPPGEKAPEPVQEVSESREPEMVEPDVAPESVYEPVEEPFEPEAEELPAEESAPAEFAKPVEEVSESREPETVEPDVAPEAVDEAQEPTEETPAEELPAEEPPHEI